MQTAEIVNEVFARKDAEIERLRAALKKIADRYPCATTETMSRVASDAIGGERGTTATEGETHGN